MSSPLPESDLERLKAGGESALGEIFSGYREVLERIVQYRIDPRVRSRIDAADVLQEAFLEINRRLPDYLASPAVSPLIWMRKLTLQILIDLHRRHFREKRSPLHEASMSGGSLSESSNLGLGPVLVSTNTSPSRFVARAEEALQVQRVLAQMNEVDREILTLRHFELLTNQQVAEVLSLSKTAASNRYVRAVARFSQLLQADNFDTTPMISRSTGGSHG